MQGNIVGIGGSQWTLGSSLIDGIFLVQKMCICSCVTLSTTLLMRAVQFNARSACDASTFTSCKIYIHDVNIAASQADRALNWTARITKNIPSISGLPMSGQSIRYLYKLWEGMSLDP